MVHRALLQHDVKEARILVVDDEPANLKLLGMILRMEGFGRVETVANPREVLDRYRADRPDLILLDLNMPGLDGFAVMAQIKALGEHLVPPILVLTAQSGEDILLRAFQAGATDFLGKPFNRRELLARVHNMLMSYWATRLLLGQNASLRQLVGEHTRELKRSRLEVVQRLARAAELRDNETGKHILRMSHASSLLARSLGWAADRCELLLSASPLHDVGKIGIPDGILLKPGSLTPEERVIMQTHTEIGADLLQGSGTDLLEMARDIALHHHEKWDGSGYPHGLSGNAIPEVARIVAITDVFDALTSARPYKKPWEVSDALQWMADQSGRHFDPKIFPHFVGLIPDILDITARFADAPEDAVVGSENDHES